MGDKAATLHSCCLSKGNLGHPFGRTLLQLDLRVRSVSCGQICGGRVQQLMFCFAMLPKKDVRPGLPGVLFQVFVYKRALHGRGPRPNCPKHSEP